MDNLLRVTSVFLMFTFCLLIACNKRDPEPISCLIAASVDSYGNVFTYQYESGVLRSVTRKRLGLPDRISTYEYDGNGNLSAIAYNPDGKTERFTYSEGEIVKLEEYIGTKQTRRTDYEYSGSRLVKLHFYYGPSFAEKWDHISLEYEGKSNNLIRFKHFDPTSSVPLRTTDFNYGDKRSRYAALPQAVLKYLRLSLLPTENNLIKVTGTSDPTRVAGQAEDITYTYEFDGLGFPTKSIETYQLGRVDTFTTTYNCE